MNNLLHLFFPNDDRKFFCMLAELSIRVARGARIFKDFVDTYQKLPQKERSQRVVDIKELEHQCDELAHLLTLRLQTKHTHYQETVHAAATELAAMMDAISAASRRMVLFHVEEINPELQQLALLVNNSCQEVATLMQQLQKPKDRLKTINRIKGLETEADYVYTLAMTELFSSKHDARELLVFKDLYDVLEDVVDQTECVARIVENMVAKERL